MRHPNEGAAGIGLGDKEQEAQFLDSMSSVVCLSLREGKLVVPLVKKLSNRGLGSENKLYLPGGRGEYGHSGGETPVQCAVRETAEEARLQFEAGALYHALVVHKNNKDGTPYDHHFFVCWDGDGVQLPRQTYEVGPPQWRAISDALSREVRAVPLVGVHARDLARSLFQFFAVLEEVPEEDWHHAVSVIASCRRQSPDWAHAIEEAKTAVVTHLPNLLHHLPDGV